MDAGDRRELITVLETINGLGEAPAYRPGQDVVRGGEHHVEITAYQEESHLHHSEEW